MAYSNLGKCSREVVKRDGHTIYLVCLPGCPANEENNQGNINASGVLVSSDTTRQR